MRNIFRGAVAWWVVFLLGFVPLIYIVLAAVQGELGAEPAKALVEYLGEVAIVVLLFVLSLTPLRKIKLLSGLNRFRRMVGLFVFFYAVLHLLSYAFLLVDWQNFIEDLYSRLYVMAGAIAFLLLMTLAVTSPKCAVRRLGRRWKSLHRLIYVALFAVLVHVFWQVRSDYTEAVLYAGFAAFLMCFRYGYLKGLWFRSQ